MSMDGTGTVYGLRDPRDGVTRYIGATTKTLTARLSGHLSGKAAPRVRAWVAELRAAGLRPETYAIKENVPAAELLAAEGDEITRIIVAGGSLLNENATARGRELLRLSREAQRIAAEKAAWQELATTAITVLGGPIPPPRVVQLGIPDETWHFMAKVRAQNAEASPGSYTYSLRPPSPSSDQFRLWVALRDEHEYAQKQLVFHARLLWPRVLELGGSSWAERVEQEISFVVGTPHESREDAARHVALSVWFIVAVYPWWHLANLAGLAEDDTSFIAWAARDARTRRALTFLAAVNEGRLGKLSWGHDSPSDIGPGQRLATVAAAYSDSPSPPAVHSIMKRILERYADDHMLTQPMANLFLLLDPQALDSVYGKDVAAEIDRELDLALGTSGRVLRALIERTGRPRQQSIRHAADRSTQTFPVTAVPGYDGWEGPGVPGARIIGASLVRAGLATPAQMPPKEYLAKVSALWTPDLNRLELRRSA